MKLQLLNTPHGLVPMYDADYDEKRKLAIGKVYVADIRLARNYKFLQKAFSLCHTAWNLLPEKTRSGFHDSFDCFRDTITVAAGYTDVYYNMSKKEWDEKPKSWAFDKMDEAEFSGLYERMKDVIWSILSKRINITQEVFESYLANY